MRPAPYPPPITRGTAWPRVLGVAALVLAVAGPIISIPLAWHFYSSARLCRDTYIVTVAIAFGILAVPSVVSVALSVAGQVLARRGGARPSSRFATVSLGVTAVLMMFVLGGGALMAGTLIVFADDLRC